MADQGGSIWGVLLLLMLVALFFSIYFIPTSIYASREKSNVGLFFLVNLLVGWTLLGWIILCIVSIMTPVNNYIIIDERGKPMTADKWTMLQKEKEALNNKR